MVAEKLPINALEVFELVQAEFKKPDSLFKHCDLNVQEDSLDRLRREEADYEDECLTISYAVKTRDHDLPFGVAFYPEFFLVHVGQFATFYQAYDYFASPKALVAQVKLCLGALFDRQLRVLISTNNGKPYAVEVLLNTTPDARPVVILSDAKFPLFKQQGDDTTVLYNARGGQGVTLPKDFFLYAKLPSGTYPIQGRKLKSNAFTPLTKTEMDVATQQSMYQTTAIKEDEQAWQYVLWTWQFWTIFITAIVIAIKVVPEDWRGLYYPIVGLFSFYFILPRITKDTADKRPLLYRMYTALPSWVRNIDQVAVFMVAFIATFFMTDSYLLNTTTPTSYYQVALRHQELLLPMVSAALLTLLCLAAAKKRLRIVKVLLYLATVTGYFVLQARYISQTDGPETLQANTAGIIGVFGLIMALVVLVYRVFAGRRRHLQGNDEIS